MNKVIATTIAAFLVAQVASALSTSVDFASAYVFRGAEVNEGFVVQPGVEGEVAGLTVGVWANIDIDNVGADQVSEIDLYLAKDLGSVAGWDVSAGYCEYTYPGSTGDGESELSLSASGAVGGVDLSVSAFADIAETSTPGYYEASTGGSTAVAGVALDYGIAVGYFDTDADASTGFGYAAYSVSYETGGGTLSATYIDGLDDDVVTVDTSVVLAYGISL
jgi:uncharacterized protein (TIGR02001 family)